MSIYGDLQSFKQDAKIDLYIISEGKLGTETFHFHSGANEFKQNIVWQGVEYVAIPMEASGFEFNGKQFPRPKFKVANLDGIITGLVSEFDDLIGCKVTRKQTTARYLDAVNFENGNDNADPSQQYPNEQYYITQKTAENKVYIEFELGTILDLSGVAIPVEQCIANTCRFRYRVDKRCGYSGGAVADKYDNPTTDTTKDACSHKVNGCKLRFGANNPLRFGGFSGIALIEFK